MCFCCQVDTSDPSSKAPVLSGADCAHSVSEIRLIDETGLGLANVRVKCDFGDGPVETSTDDQGRICLSAPIGTTVVVTALDVHEMKPGEAQSTKSGDHFAWRAP